MERLKRFNIEAEVTGRKTFTVKANDANEAVDRLIDGKVEFEEWVPKSAQINFEDIDIKREVTIECDTQDDIGDVQEYLDSLHKGKEILEAKRE